MVISRKIIADFSDLNILCMKCFTCKVELRFDISRSDFTVPEKCPSCNVPFEAAKHQIDAFRHSYEGLVNSKHKITVEIDNPNGE